MWIDLYPLFKYFQTIHMHLALHTYIGTWVGISNNFLKTKQIAQVICQNCLCSEEVTRLKIYMKILGLCINKINEIYF
jgi:hypothetical protein